ncbi:MAG: hypothetical protein HDR21_02280 [Lachnospiraceae bacterium]|nr:hypothetical protein [Lachnospiraceae bacterium]
MHRTSTIHKIGYALWIFLLFLFCFLFSFAPFLYFFFRLKDHFHKCLICNLTHKSPPVTLISSG